MFQLYSNFEPNQLTHSLKIEKTKPPGEIFPLQFEALFSSPSQPLYTGQIANFLC